MTVSFKQKLVAVLIFLEGISKPVVVFYLTAFVSKYLNKC